MNFTWSLLIAACICFACNNESGSKNTDTDTEKTLNGKTDKLPATDSIGLTYFGDLMGKYPNQIKLFEREDLVIRLKKMMGADFDFLKQNWETEVPIEISNGIAFTWGMQAHSGGDPGAALCADINRNILYTSIRKDGKVQTFTEAESPLPAQLQDWIKGGE